jgi:osmotically-inducible protein OsmY
MLVTELPGPHCGCPAPAPLTRNVAEQAESRLRAHGSLALKNIACDYRDGVLTLSGCLPTYYLKQVAQAVVGQLDGVQHLVNDIEVMPASPRLPSPY